MSDYPEVELAEQIGRNAPKFDVTDSVALKRIIDEVRNEDAPSGEQSTTYNRTYHRHNR